MQIGEKVSTAGGPAPSSARADLLANLDDPPAMRCGFWGAGDEPVSKAELVDQIQQRAQEENNRWFEFGGLGEIEGAHSEGQAAAFKYLCVYSLSYLFRGDAMTPQRFLDVRRELLAYSGLRRTSNASTVATAIHRTVGGESRVRSRIAQSINQAKTAASGSFPWSAVFVTYCVRRAALDLGIEWFDGTRTLNTGSVLALAASHGHYGQVAYARTLAGIRGTYHAFPPETATVEVGDIIIQDRRQRIRPSADCYEAGLTPASVRGLAGLRGRPGCTHGDIVVEVDSGGAVAIGGNVAQSVRRRRYPLTAEGLVDIDHAEQRLYAQEDAAGHLGPATTADPDDTIPGRSTSRVFAVLKPMELCAVAGPVVTDAGILI
ncbi:MAG: DUF2272 domain-containing protein [Myxococcota bacterium]